MLHGESVYSAISGIGQISHRDHISLDLGYQIVKEWAWSIGGHYEVDRGVFSAATNRTENVNGTGTLRYAPWEWGSFDLTGDATQEWSDALNFAHITRYTVSLGFTLGKTNTAF